MRPNDVKRPLAIALFVLVACGRATTDEPRPRASAEARLYQADSTVLDDGTHGPQLCVYGVMESFPPQCEGLPIENWDWSLVTGEEAAQGARWGQFHVVGSYDGESFTLVRATEYRHGPESGPSGDFSVPCPEPAGGWVAHDPARVSEDDRLAAIRYANDQADHAGTWVQTVDGESVAVVDERMILTVTFTGELQRHEERLSGLWGGPLCVARHRLSLRELSQIQRELSDEQPFGLETTWSSLDVPRNRVELGVIVADDGARAAIDQRYGEGVVELYPALQPVS